MTERTHKQSKKFAAYLLADLGWKAVIFGVLFLIRVAMTLENGELTTTLASLTTLGMTVVAIAGFVQVGYILGQSYLDKYVRLAQITHGKGSESSDSGVELDSEDE